MTRMPTYFISHGGGPWPWVPKMRAVFSNLEASFHQMHGQLPERPKAVLMISGHWESAAAQVMSSPKPPMEYDYFGFPEHTYQVTYAAPGAPWLAARVKALLDGAGIGATLNDTQGYDHGTFVPMHILYPDADMPLIQLSMLDSYDPEAHLAMGRALAPLRDEGVLIVGSGLSFHNLRLMNPEAKVPSHAFDAWLAEALAAAPDVRSEAMRQWEPRPMRGSATHRKIIWCRCSLPLARQSRTMPRRSITKRACWAG